jgi:hypothetical protein
MKLQSRLSIRIPWPRLTARPYTILITLVLVGLAVPMATRGSSDWMQTFVPAATLLIHGDDLYDGSAQHGFVYPPFQALFAVPLVGMAPMIQRLAWYAVHAVLLVLVLRSAWRFAGGRDLESIPEPWPEHAAMHAGLIVGLTYAFNSMMHQQTDLLLTWLILKAIEWMRTDRWQRAAVLIGIAAAMKCTPLLFMPYFIIRGRIIAAMMILFTAITANLLPDAITSPGSHFTWLSKWADLFLKPMTAADHRPGVWASGLVYNQSLIGGLNRWTTSTWTIESGRVVITATLPIWTSSQLKICIIVAAGVAAAVSLVGMMHVRRIDPTIALSVDASMVICGMLLFSPMSSPAHFGILILPAFLLARQAFIKRSAVAAACLAVMVLTAVASNKDLVGPTIYTLGLWFGTPMICTMAALIGMWRLIVKRSG